MLSEELLSLATRLEEFKHCGVQMNGENVAALLAVLDKAAVDARALEQAAIPMHMQIPCFVTAHRVKGMLVYDGGRS